VLGLLLGLVRLRRQRGARELRHHLGRLLRGLRPRLPRGPCRRRHRRRQAGALLGEQLLDLRARALQHGHHLLLLGPGGLLLQLRQARQDLAVLLPQGLHRARVHLRQLRRWHRLRVRRRLLLLLLLLLLLRAGLLRGPRLLKVLGGRAARPWTPLLQHAGGSEGVLRCAAPGRLLRVVLRVLLLLWGHSRAHARIEWGPMWPPGPLHH
jgi:hypothetical protein